MPGCLHRGPLPAGQLPLQVQGVARGVRQPGLRPARRPPGGRDTPARHAGPCAAVDTAGSAGRRAAARAGRRSAGMAVGRRAGRRSRRQPAPQRPPRGAACRPRRRRCRRRRRRCCGQPCRRHRRGLCGERRRQDREQPIRPARLLHAAAVRGDRRLRGPRGRPGPRPLSGAGGREGRRAAGSGRRRLPRRCEVGFPAAGQAPVLPGGERRRERAGHVQGPAPHGTRPAPADRGQPDRELRPGRAAVLPLRARGDGPGAGAHSRGPERGLRRRLRGPPRPGHRVLRGRGDGLGRGGLHRRRGDRPDREPGGQPGDAQAEAPLLPSGGGPVLPADHSEQCGDPQQSAVAAGQRRRRLQGARLGVVAGHPAVRRVGPCRPPGRVRGGAWGDHVQGADLRRRLLPGDQGGKEAEDVHTGRRVCAVVLRGAARPAAGSRARRQSRLDAGVGSDSRDGRDHRRCGGRFERRGVLRPRVLRQVHALPGGHQLAAAHNESDMQRPGAA